MTLIDAVTNLILILRRALTNFSCSNFINYFVNPRIDTYQCVRKNKKKMKQKDKGQYKIQKYKGDELCNVCLFA